MAGKFCPKCNQTYAPQQQVCPADQEVLSFRDPYHLVGRVLMGKYRVDALIGLGGMGAVYCTQHLGISRRVAFKILQPNIAVGGEQIIKMFEREARLVGRLAHENIVDVKDAGQTDEGISYIVMEWLEGRTLEEALAGSRRLPFPRIVSIGRQIASALVEAHKNQIIHRDLKPSNVMLLNGGSRGELVKVLDFGISKALETTGGGPVSTIVGTPHYASLEQLTVGETIDGRSDLYSLGVILYRGISGSFPFNGNSMGELIHRQMTFTPPPLHQLRSDTPRELERLVTRMISKSPDDRPASAEEVVATLDRLLGLPDASALETELLSGPATVSTGETTIQRPKPVEQPPTDLLRASAPTASISASTPKGTAKAVDYSTSVMPESNAAPALAASDPPPPSKRSPWLIGLLAAAALAAGGYGAYRYSDAAPGKNQPEPQATVNAIAIHTPEPATPTPTTIALAPSPKATAAVKPKPSPSAKPEKPLRNDSTPPPAQLKSDFQLAEEYYKQAEAYYDQSRFGMAIREATAAIQLNPNHTKARELRRKAKELFRILRRPSPR